MNYFMLSRTTIKQTIISNLISSNILAASEAQNYLDLLDVMSDKDLLVALLGSHEDRENCLNPIEYYPIGEISKN